MNLQTTLDAIQQADSQEAIFSIAHCYSKAIGVTGMSYYQLNNHKQFYQLKDRTLFLNGDAAFKRWSEHYQQETLWQVDPVVSQLIQTLYPVVWDTHQPQEWFTSQQQKVFYQARDFQQERGISLIVHHPVGIGIFGYFLGVNSFPDLRAESLSSLSLLTNYVHAACQVLSTPRIASKTSQTLLTQREKDCLCWIQQGLNAAQVADLLKISEHTVVFHLQNAKRKLGANSLPHAVALALSQGITSL